MAPTAQKPTLEAYLVTSDIEPIDDVDLDSIPELVKRARRHDDVVWLRLVEPDEQMIEHASRVLELHPLAVADVSTGRQQPKVQKLAEHVFVMLWCVLANDDPEPESGGDSKTEPESGGEGVVLGQTFLYIGDGWLLTVQRGGGARVRDLREIVESAPVELREGALPVAYTIMADVVSGYAEAAADVEDELERLEEQVFSEGNNEDHRDIYRLRKNIGRVDRAVSSIAAALRESTGHLEALSVGNERIVPYLHDLLDDAAGTAALINNQSKALDAILSSHENNVAARQNQDMRTISAFAALLAVPTLVAGVYGMNFKNIPLVQWQWGWLVIALSIVAIDVLIYVMFKRRHWL